MEESIVNEQQNSGAEKIKKPKSSGNKSFRKHNKIGFYRLIRRKKKSKTNSQNTPNDNLTIDD